MANVNEINAAMIEVAKFGAIAGFIAASTILINLNYHAFESVFRVKNKTFWLLFFTITTIPLGLILIVFSFFFE